MEKTIEKIAEDERSLTDNEISKLIEYICFAVRERQKVTKDRNFLVIHKHFLAPSVGLHNLPLDDIDSEYQYYTSFIKDFSDVLIKGTITDSYAKRLKLYYPKGFS